MSPTPAARHAVLPPAAQIGRIEPEKQRFYKVGKHLLNPQESWHLICAGLSSDARNEALRAGCFEPCLDEKMFRFELTLPGCSQHLLTAHDVHLEPAYRRALESAERRGCILPDAEKGTTALALGDEGVFVALRQDKASGRWRVATAYRPEIPERRGSIRTNQDYVNAARRKWKDKQNRPAKGKP